MSMMLDDYDTTDFDSEHWEDIFGDGEDLDGDDYGADYGDDFDDDSWDDEASAAERRKKRRAGQLAMQRRRRRATALAASRRRRRRRPAPRRRSAPTPRAAVSAIRTLDLENKVQDDSLRAALANQRKRQDRAEVATVAAVVAKQVQDSFQGSVDLLDNPFAKAALTAAPLLLLPSRKKDGVGGYLTDPKFLGLGAVALIAFIGDQQNKSDEVGEVRITGAAEIDDGDETVLLVDVFDKRGKRLTDKTVEFTVDPPTIASVDANGRVAGLAPGVAVITAKVDEVTARHVLTVRATTVDVSGAPALRSK